MDELLSNYLKDLLDDLDAVAEKHGEIMDTDCREQMFGAIYAGFLKPGAGYALPERFGLYEPEGNAAARAALHRYISRAGERAEQLEMADPNARLAAFNAPVLSDQGVSADEYFGWIDVI